MAEEVPQHKQCARHVCPNPKTEEGNWHYCSEKCRNISKLVNSSEPPLPEWKWAPTYRSGEAPGRQKTP